MRKRIISPALQEKLPPTTNQAWLNVEDLVEVEVTSENPTHPIESALLLQTDNHSGWQASEPGKQTIRLIFTEPQALQRIWLHFVETQIERTQEYVLRWSSDGGQTFQEIVRQQWNFSTSGSNNETEDHQVSLQSVTVLELNITPDTEGSSVRATLNQLRLA